jgi:hypothetical protein
MSRLNATAQEFKPNYPLSTLTTECSTASHTQSTQQDEHTRTVNMVVDPSELRSASQGEAKTRIKVLSRPKQTLATPANGHDGEQQGVGHGLAVFHAAQKPHPTSKPKKSKPKNVETNGDQVPTPASALSPGTVTAQRSHVHANGYKTPPPVPSAWIQAVTSDPKQSKLKQAAEKQQKVVDFQQIQTQTQAQATVNTYPSASRSYASVLTGTVC